MNDQTEAKQFVDALPGLKERDLERLGPCRVCGKPLIDGDLTFYRVKVARYGVMVDPVQRRVGLGQAMGSGRLAAVMGPDEDLAKRFSDESDVVVHERCAGTINHVMELIRDDGDDKAATG